MFSQKFGFRRGLKKDWFSFAGFWASLAVLKRVDILKILLIESGDFAEQTVYPYERIKTIERTRIHVNAYKTAMWLIVNKTSEYVVSSWKTALMFLCTFRKSALFF